MGCNCLSEAAGVAGILADKHVTGLSGDLVQKLGIKRLDGVHVDQSGLDALLCQNLDGLDGFVDDDLVAGNDGKISALGKHVALAQLHLTGLVAQGTALSAKSGVCALSGLVGLDGQVVDALVVRRIQDNQLGNQSHQTYVLKRHVSSAVDLGGDTGIGSDEVHSLAGIVCRQEELVICTP